MEYQNRFGSYNNHQFGSLSRTVSTFRNEEFNEEDVWGALNERKGGNPSDSSSYNPSDHSVISQRLPTAISMIPKYSGGVRNPTAAQPQPKTTHQQCSSAPVNIPDWSKIYGTSKNTKPGSINWLDGDDDDRDRGMFDRSSSWESEEEDDGVEVVPPHEWIARKMARSQISSFSVCEGAGRTLKGRDLSRVRNAVLTRTGFLE